MQYGILLNETAAFVALPGSIGPEVEIDSLLFAEAVNYDYEFFFYDILEGADGRLAAIEFHLDSSHEISKALVGLPYVTKSTFPCLWIRERQAATARGLEAFGGIRMFEAGSGVKCLAVSVDDWFTDGDRGVLSGLLTHTST
jgi:hypothetical protein